MITFKEFLHESHTLNDHDIHKLAEKIRTKCSKFLSECDIPLYRGISEPIDSNFQTTEEDRQPRNTDIKLHNLLDDWFYTNFGIKFRSNHVVFASPDLSSVLQYGDTYVIFPIGEYDYIWSKKIPDLYLHLTHNDDHVVIDNMKELELLIHTDDYHFNEDINDNEHSEVMIHCKSYYVIDIDSYKKIKELI